MNLYMYRIYDKNSCISGIVKASSFNKAKKFVIEAYVTVEKMTLIKISDECLDQNHVYEIWCE